MKLLQFILLVLFCIPTISHGQSTSTDTLKKETKIITKIPKENFERPFNYFAAAGVGFRLDKMYDATISPIDYSVQFEEVFSIHTRFSMGLVWNPFPNNKSPENQGIFQKALSKSGVSKSGDLIDRSLGLVRRHGAVALLVNIAQLSFTASEINTTSLIDVGFGLGYRNDHFLILGTIEFIPMRSPRNYFLKDFQDKDLPLILAGTEEPVRTISIEDNALFKNKISPSVGIKIAYAFTSDKK